MLGVCCGYVVCWRPQPSIENRREAFVLAFFLGRARFEEVGNLRDNQTKRKMTPHHAAQNTSPLVGSLDGTEGSARASQVVAGIGPLGLGYALSMFPTCVSTTSLLSLFHTFARTPQRQHSGQTKRPSSTPTMQRPRAPGLLMLTAAAFLLAAVLCPAPCLSQQLQVSSTRPDVSPPLRPPGVARSRRRRRRRLRRLLRLRITPPAPRRERRRVPSRIQTPPPYSPPGFWFLPLPCAKDDVWPNAVPSLPMLLLARSEPHKSVRLPREMLLFSEGNWV
jgi:hypothetical protein